MGTAYKVSRNVKFAKDIIVKRVCPRCNKVATISITERGDWEYWNCQSCGGIQGYKVR